MPRIGGNLTPVIVQQIGRTVEGYTPSAFPGTSAFRVVRLDDGRNVAPQLPVILRGTEPELQGGAGPITVDMELLTAASSSFAPTGVATAGLTLLSAAVAGQEPSPTEALTLALLAASAAGQAPSAASAATMALLAAGATPQAPSPSATAEQPLQSAAAQGQAPSAGSAATAGLLSTGIAAQDPSPAASTEMPLLSGGPGTQAPTPGASLDVPLATTQLVLFDPEAILGQPAITVDMPLLETLAIAPALDVELEQPPVVTFSAGRARRTAPTAQPITVQMELLGIRATIEPWELGIWTVLRQASLEARLELYEPTVTLTWPAEQMQAELERMLLGEEEDLLGIGI